MASTGNCSKCGIEATTICSGCSKVFYCSQECQRWDWHGGHKEICRKTDSTSEKDDGQADDNAGERTVSDESKIADEEGYDEEGYDSTDEDDDLNCTLEEAMATKLKGNTAFQQAKNAADCDLRLKNWVKAATNASIALDFDPTNDKARYRLAQAMHKLGRYISAMGSAARVNNPQGRKLYEQIRFALVSIIDKNKATFCRIIDSYRLRVEDEYMRTGDFSMHSRYGMRAEGRDGPPMKHFRAYVRLGVNKEIIPASLAPNENSLDLQALEFMAYTDDTYNIDYAVEQHDIQEHYRKVGCTDTVASLRHFAASIIGPLPALYAYNGDSSEDLLDYMSEEEEDKDVGRSYRRQVLGAYQVAS